MLTLTAGYTWTLGEEATAAKMNLTAVPTLAAGQSYAFGAGSADVPSIGFDGDANTGLYRPAADTLALVTGGVAALAISSSGDVYTTRGKPIAAGNSALGSNLKYGGFYKHTSGALRICQLNDDLSVKAEALAIDGSGNLAQASGTSLQLGCTYAAGAPTPTGYLTLKDATGATYRVPAVLSS